MRPVLFVGLHPKATPELSMIRHMFGGSDTPNAVVASVKAAKDDYKWFAEREAVSYIEDLPQLDNISAIVLTGSSFAAYPRLIEEIGRVYFMAPWKLRFMQYLKLAHHKNIPILGICFGEHIVTEALGGKVELMKSQDEEEMVEVAWSRVTVAPGAVYDPIFGNLPPELIVPENHTDVVSRLPEGAQLAYENQFGLQGYVIPGLVWAVEFHPERQPSEVTEYLTSGDNSKRLSRGRVEVDQNLKLGKGYNPAITQIFSRFLDVVKEMQS